MELQEVALVSAGVLGVLVSIVHGVLSQRLMVAPVSAMLKESDQFHAALQRLIPGLLHFSTYNWSVSGLALIVAGLWLGEEARMITALLAGSSYMVGALGNLWGTQGRHPGWVLLAVTVALIVAGVWPG